MKGKTLTITITPETAVGCIDALVNVAKIDLKDRSVELLVALSLEGFINQLRTNGHILPIEEEDAIRRLAIYESAYQRQRAPAFEDVDLQFNREQAGLPPKETEEASYSTIERAMDNVKNQGVEIPVTVNESPEPTTPVSANARDALLQMDRESLSRFQAQMGDKDELVNQAEHEGGNFQIAVEIVYSKIPQTLWGSEKARELVGNVLEELKNG